MIVHQQISRYSDMIGQYTTFQQRRWGVACVEVASIFIFALCFSVVFDDRTYPIGELDVGMARITAICFMLVSAGMFILAVCVKRLDIPSVP